MSSYANKNLFSLEFEHDNIHARNVAHMPLLTINARLKQTSALDSDFVGRRIELFSLSGIMRYYGLYVPMRPLLSFGFGALDESGISLSLEIELTASQVEYLEQGRLQNGARADMELDLQLHGRVMVQSNWATDKETFRFDTIETAVQGSLYGSIRIARSDWHERLLPGLGYNERLLIELPLPGQFGESEQIEQVAEAIEKLETARRHLLNEHYREAVHFCREAKDALTKRDPKELMNLLEPLIGTTKAATVDSVLLAFGKLYTASSHPATLPKDERIEFTYEDAQFAVNTMTFVLDYVARALETQDEYEEDEDEDE